MNQNKFSGRIREAAKTAEQQLLSVFSHIDEVSRENQERVLCSFIENRVSDSHFVSSTGYGYGDTGREVTDRIFASVFGTQDALVRYSFVNGTHTIYTALAGLLRPGDTLLSATSSPYDTLLEGIGIVGEGSGSLRDFDIKYRQVELLPDGAIDIDAVMAAMDSTVKVVFMQKSRGYSLRRALTSAEIGQASLEIKESYPNVKIVVDNCYGEFTEKTEPTMEGADIVAGSLIKNPGGGIAKTGGYICGDHESIEKISNRYTTPGIGRECGCTLGATREILQGLFMAPHTVAQSLKTSAFCGSLLKLFGVETYPQYDEYKSDIIQSIIFHKKEPLIEFCRGIQAGSPVDSFVSPEPWEMPGYENKVIMASGAFIQGSSIELSCDAPIKEPYCAYLQGGLTYEAGRFGVMSAVNRLFEAGYIE